MYNGRYDVNKCLRHHTPRALQPLTNLLGNK